MNADKEAYTSFTKSVGTTFYIAPEVHSAGKGKYNEKADVSPNRPALIKDISFEEEAQNLINSPTYTDVFSGDHVL